MASVINFALEGNTVDGESTWVLCGKYDYLSEFVQTLE
jgi:hypothetical protein